MGMTRQEKLNYIADHYMKLMLKRAYSVVSHAPEAEDACQEAFLRIIKNIDRIDDVTELRVAALCGTIARNAAIDIYRKNAKLVPVEEVYGAENDNGADALPGAAGTSPGGMGGFGSGPPDGPYEQVQQKEAVDRLAGLIRGLPENYREVLELRCLNGFRAAETGRLLGLSENTVNIRLTRARKLLKERMDEP